MTRTRIWHTFVAIGIAVAAAPSAHAEPSVSLDPPARYDISFNVIGPVGGLIVSTLLGQDVLLFGAEFERQLRPSITAYLGPGLVVGTVFGKPVVGGTLSLGGRYYFSRNAPSGLWVGPDATGTLSVGLGARVWTASVGAFGGYNFLFSQHLLLSLGAGVSLRAGTLGLGPLPAIRGNIGYVF